MYRVDDFPVVFLTADIVVVQSGRILLIERKHEPFRGAWALPGGFFDVETDSDIMDAAVRELSEETSLTAARDELEWVGVFSKKNRDPREAIASKPCRIVSTAFLLRTEKALDPCAKDDAKQLRWFDLNALPDLAFDHAEIIDSALKRARDHTTR